MKSPKEMWVLPTKAFSLIKLIAKEKIATKEEFEKDRKYSKTREAFAVAVYISQKIIDTGVLWYIRKNDIENSEVDIYTRAFYEENKIQYGSPIIPIQVVRFTKYQNNLLEEIKIKLKDDLKDVVLICHIQTKQKIIWSKLNRQIKKIKPNLKEIVLIGDISPGNFVVGQIYPKKKVNFIDLESLSITGSPILLAEEVSKPDDTHHYKIGTGLITTEFDIVDG